MATTRVKFNASKKDFFYAQLKERMNNYFVQHNNNDKANAAMFFKMVVIALLFFGTYALILSNSCSDRQLILLALLFGFSNGLIAFNISHDASHHALFRSKNWNHLFSYTFNLIGDKNKQHVLA